MFVQSAIKIAESGYLPESVVRVGIRHLLKRRKEEQQQAQHDLGYLAAFIQKLSDGPIAEQTSEANQQHYEVPSAFFRTMLGPYLKYSSGLWTEDCQSLEDAEVAMLDKTIKRAGIQDGMRVLDLGCGWGSLSKRIAEVYPNCKITAVSNSKTQKKFIDMFAAQAGLTNLSVITADINDFQANETFDRVVSVEMFEHVRNYKKLLTRIRQWLKSDGKLFIHIFCHHDTPYFFESEDESDWMTTHFFSGGIMPHYDLPSCFPELFRLETRWRVNGTHYAKTLSAWLKNLDQNKEQCIELLAAEMGQEAAKVSFERWRLFNMACEELFADNAGLEWFVGHYLLKPTELEG